MQETRLRNKLGLTFTRLHKAVYTAIAEMAALVDFKTLWLLNFYKHKVIHRSIRVINQHRSVSKSFNINQSLIHFE